MRSVSNPPGRFFATAKMIFYWFPSLNNTTAEKFKLLSIIDLPGACTCHASKVIANYLRTLMFPDLLPLQSTNTDDNYENVYYDVNHFSLAVQSLKQLSTS